MSTPTRTLLLLMLLALGGISVLSWMARRYGEVLEARVESGPAAAQRVDAFVEVRRAMRSAADKAAGRKRDELREALRAVRDRALARGGRGFESYRTTREEYRRWRLGRSEDADLEAAFRSRAAALREVDLGDYESLDGD